MTSNRVQLCDLQILAMTSQLRSRHRCISAAPMKTLTDKQCAVVRGPSDHAGLHLDRVFSGADREGLDHGDLPQMPSFTQWYRSAR